MRAFRKLSDFLKAYLAIKRQADPEKVMAALGKPATLELSEEQAREVEYLFCGFPVNEGMGNGAECIKRDPPEVARSFFKHWPRTEFRYFMALSPDCTTLEFTNADPALDGVELIQAAMIKLGAIKKHDDDGEWYYQTAHPMVKRMAQMGANQGDLTAITKKQSILA